MTRPLHLLTLTIGLAAVVAVPALAVIVVPTNDTSPPALVRPLPSTAVFCAMVESMIVTVTAFIRTAPP